MKFDEWAREAVAQLATANLRLPVEVGKEALYRDMREGWIPCLVKEARTLPHDGGAFTLYRIEIALPSGRKREQWAGAIWVRGLHDAAKTRTAVAINKLTRPIVPGDLAYDKEKGT